MTTIVYKDGVLAGDGRVTVNDMVVTDKATKVHKIKGGWLYGWCGGVEDAEILKRALRKGLPDQLNNPQLNNITALLIDHAGTIALYEGSIWIVQKEPYYAIGSGSPYALGALDAGADAIAAAKIATARDTNSGGKVRSVRLK